MDENRLRFGVGVLVVAAIGTGIILTFLFGAFPTVLKQEYTVNVWFPSAEGVSTNTQVLRDGVKIGRVVDITLQPEGAKPEGGVMLKLAIDQHRQMSHAYLPQIGVGSLITGESKLEFVKADAKTLASVFKSNTALIDQPYTHDETFAEGRKADDPFSVLFGLEDEIRRTMLSIRNAGETIEMAGQQVNELASEIQTVVGKTDTASVTNQAQKSLQEFQLAIQDIRGLLNDPRLRKNLNDSFDRIPGVLDDTQATLQATRDTVTTIGTRLDEIGVATTRTIESIERTVGSAEQTVKNVEKITEPFANRSEEYADLALQTLVDFDQTLLQAEQFARALNNGDGTLRRLIEDDEMYFEFRRTVQNVEMASAKLRPIMDDVRVFTDKIARDPRQLGVRGALTKQPTGTGLK